MEDIIIGREQKLTIKLPKKVTFYLICRLMRIIKEKTLKEYFEQARYKRAEQPIRSWIYEVRFSNWGNASELKAKYKNASVISSKRVVFDIGGNNYRLVVDI